MKFSTEIKALRKKRNETQMQFAKWLDTPIATLRNWEQGKNEPSRLQKAFMLTHIKIFTIKDVSRLKLSNRDSKNKK